MILECPRCTTRFRVPEDAVGVRGRLVQCGSCNLEWTAHTDNLLEDHEGLEVSISDDPAIVQTVESSGWDPSVLSARQQEQLKSQQISSEKLDSFDVLTRPRAPGTNPSIGWFGLSGFVLLLTIVFTLFRVPIVEGFPPINKMYETLGVPVILVGRGLEIRPPSATALVGPQNRILTINGIIRNQTPTPIVVPSLTASLRDANGHDVYSWAFLPKESLAGPADTVRYETSVRNPPVGASGIFISFITEDEIEDGELFVDIGEDPSTLPDASRQSQTEEEQPAENRSLNINLSS